MKNSLFFSSGDITSQEIKPSESGSKTYEWVIFREGRFQHPWYGTLDFDTNYLESIVENHKRNVLNRKVGFDAAHAPANGAVSWIEDQESGLYIREATFDSNTGMKTRAFLCARHELTPLGEELVKNKIYRYFSSEIDPNYSSGEIETIRTDKGDVETVLEFGPTLIGGGIVMRPFIPNLGPVAFSDGESKNVNKDIALFASQDGDSTGVFMFNDAVDMIKNNQSKKFFQFGSNISLGNTEDECRDGKQGVGEPAKLSSEDEPRVEAFSAGDENFGTVSEDKKGEKLMKFSEILAKANEIDEDKAKVEYLESVQQYFSEGDDALVFQAFLAGKKEIVQARAEAEEALQRKIKLQSENEALAADKIKMANDLREAREGSRQAQVKQFSAELREAGHTEAVVKEVESILTGLPAESYSQSFSVKGAKEEADLNLTFKDMISRIFAKLPKGATPVTGEDVLESNQDVSAPQQAGARSGETAVDPDAGAQAFSEPAEQGDDVPQNVLAFAEKHGYLPSEDVWNWIDNDGLMHIGGIKNR